MDIFVGSLPFKLKEEEVKQLFEPYGEVSSAKIIIDKITRQNKGFGFIEMPNDEEALKAISALNQTEVQGRTIVVNKSEKKDPNEPKTFRGSNPKRDNYPKEEGFQKGSFKGGFTKGGGGGSHKGDFKKGGFKGGFDKKSGGGNKRRFDD